VRTVKRMRALIVSYSFPPVGGAGVQRVLKLVKYLPAHGVTPAVLTVENPSVPVSDTSLVHEVPPDVEVLRARTLEPGYHAKQAAWRAEAGTGPGASAIRRRAVALARQLLVPDPQLLWLPLAARALARRLARGEDDAILVSGPPFSQFLLAPLARARRGTAVVLDYRDEWATTRTAYEMGGAALAGAALERAVLHAAHAVVTATDEFRAALLDRFRFLDPARVHTIPNGYDPDDFPPILPEPPTDRFVLTYVGTVFRLTSARGLLEAVKRLHAERPELARLLEVRFIGRVVETEAAAFAGTEALGVHRLGYLEHARAVEELAASHAALCLLDDVAGAERIYPAKIFEILYLGRPCLTLAPEGALATLARKLAPGDVVGPRDVDAIVATLARWLTLFREGLWSGVTAATGGRPVEIGRFHRRRLAGEFAAVLAAAVADAQSDDRAQTLATSAMK
jgi:glycosyltransferase involved in cell wall biosynthesis